jgi:hypothetical protein
MRQTLYDYTYEQRTKTEFLNGAEDIPLMQLTSKSRALLLLFTTMIAGERLGAGFGVCYP